jgi:glycosyltransferase involved in cell wall biosynthesis
MSLPINRKDKQMSLRIAMLGTYPPTQCGIATFTRSLATAISQTGQDVNIVRLRGNEDPTTNPMIIADHHSKSDVARTLRTLNDHDLVIVQHEFGIYDGDDGVEVLDIVNGITAPVISVLHTVAARPTPGQHRIVQALLNASETVVMLSESALRSLLRSHDVDRKRVKVIPHGAPKLNNPECDAEIRTRPRILTWGLLGEGKGIEWGIEALAQINNIDPLPEYFVVGQTHPNVVKRDGYRYRSHLENLAHKFGVADRVHFMDGYLDSAALARVITSADLYLLPYDARDQVTSGVLAEAMVAGGPVIATRFPHAVELLGDGTGILVDHQNPSDIAEALRRLILEPQTRDYMRARTQIKSAKFLWPSVGTEFSQLAYSIIREQRNQWRGVALEREPAACNAVGVSS